MSTENKVIVGLAAAALAGVGIGLLIAPNSGEESREKLREGTNSIANKLLNVVRSNGESLKEKATDVIDDAKSAYNQAKGYAKSEINHVEEKMNKVG